MPVGLPEFVENPEKRPPVTRNGLDFRELLVWLSTSMKRVFRASCSFTGYGMGSNYQLEEIL